MFFQSTHFQRATNNCLNCLLPFKPEWIRVSIFQIRKLKRVKTRQKSLVPWTDRNQVSRWLILLLVTTRGHFFFPSQNLQVFLTSSLQILKCLHIHPSLSSLQLRLPQGLNTAQNPRGLLLHEYISSPFAMAESSLLTGLASPDPIITRALCDWPVSPVPRPHPFSIKQGPLSRTQSVPKVLDSFLQLSRCKPRPPYS